MVAASTRSSFGHAGGAGIRILEPVSENIAACAVALRSGELVGMPTETVYGIAADALNEDAVRRTFEIKGRPSDNPVIVHLPSVDHVLRVVEAWSPTAQALAQRFWPGPITLVMTKRADVSDAVTAGLSTVAVRVPSHPVALELLARADVPISAPSANRFTGLSPTAAGEIDPAIGDHLFAILDGGACRVGIESTVVDVSGETPRILRPGGVSRAQIEEVVGPLAPLDLDRPRMSPGMYPRHYAPRTPVRCVEHLSEMDSGLCFGVPGNPFQIQLPNEPEAYATGLYSALHRLDLEDRPEIAIEAPPLGPEWEAVWDRLRKAGCSYPISNG